MHAATSLFGSRILRQKFMDDAGQDGSHANNPFRVLCGQMSFVGIHVGNICCHPFMLEPMQHLVGCLPSADPYWAANAAENNQLQI